jgi:hypothetical protein
MIINMMSLKNCTWVTSFSPVPFLDKKVLRGLVLFLFMGAMIGTGIAAPWTWTGTGTWAPPSSNLLSVGGNEVPMDAKVYESPTPRIDLRFYQSQVFKVYRKHPSAASWGSSIATVTVTGKPTIWSDTNVVEGELYEYGIGSSTGTTANYFGNVIAGIKVDRTGGSRGRMAIVVAEDIPARLPVEYAQYKADLAADGWVVHEILTPRAKDYFSHNLGTNVLSTVTVTSAGSGYTNGQDVVLTNPGGLKALGGLTVASGVLTGVTIKHSAAGFTPGEALTMTENTTGTGAVLAVGTVATNPVEHTNIRNQLITLYNAHPGELKNVVVIGKVAVPRSGVSYVGPDGHGNRASVGADAYYADMDGVWTDTGNNLSSYPVSGSSRSNAIQDGRINLAGDHKYDPTYFYQVTNPNSRLELGFGRIDFSNAIPSEYESMRMYFNKLHRYKTASADFQPGRRVCNRMNAPPTGDTVQTAMLRSMPGLVGMENIELVTNTEASATSPNLYSDDEDRDSAYTRIGGPFLFYFKGSGPPAWGLNGRAVFWTGLQSHWGYWFEPGNNTMLRRLAEDNFALSYAWSIWGVDLLYHRMGMGGDVGDMMRLSLNDRTYSVNNYPVTSTPTALFMNHLGCPSLRLYMFPPPTALSVVKSGGNPSLSWTAAVAPPVGEPQVLGYHVYRAPGIDEPFTRLTSTPITGTTYVDSSVNSGGWVYQVKAVRLETTGGGTYYNTSLGAEQSIDLDNAPAALTVVTVSLPEASWNTPYQSTLTASGGIPVYQWSVVSGSLPPGLTLSSSGTISGLATAGGTYAFTVQALDRAGMTTQKALLLTAQSHSATTFYAEANSYCGSFNTTVWNFGQASLLVAGPPYLYQPFLRFDLSSMVANNSFTRARLILTLDELSQPNSYAMVKAAMTEDLRDAWRESSTAAKPITGVANNGANQTRVTCPGHGMTTIYTATTSIAGVTGTNNSNANGTREVTIIDENTFDLPTVAYNPTLVWSAATSAPNNGLSYVKRPLDDTSVPEVNALSFPVAYGTIEFDVTEMVRKTLSDDPAKKLGLRLYTNRANGFGSEIRIVTRYAPAISSPRLVIETTDGPAITLTTPTVNPAAIHLGSSLVLNATVTPIPANAGALAVQWSKLSGPGTVTFSSINSANTTAAFSATGDYVLRLTAQDGVLTNTKDLAVRVLAVPSGTSAAFGLSDSSLVLRLPFDEGTGNTAADSSGVNPANNGTLVGDLGWSSGGKIGGAIAVGGTRVKAITGYANNGSGKVRITCVGHGLATGSLTTIAGFSGTGSLPNGVRTATYIDNDTFDVAAVTYVAGWSFASATSTTALKCVKVNHAASLDDAAKFSVSLWLKPNSIDGSTRNVFRKYLTSSSSTAYGMTIRSGVLTPNIDTKTMAGSGALPVGQWTHVAMVYDGDLTSQNFKLYINGNPDVFGQIAATGNRVPKKDTSPLWIGAINDADLLGFDGMIDEMRVYKEKALTLAEVQDLYLGAPANLGPKITLTNANVSGTAGQPVGLGAVVTDDGLPGALSLQWQKASGPGSVVFSDPVSGTTDATPSAAGSYGLRLLASDGSITTFADVAATFEPSSGGAGIASWRQLHFGTTENTGDAADDANPMGDGLRNLLKYALGLNPNVDYRGSGLMPKGQLEEVGGQEYLTYTFTRNTAVSDATLSVEVVNDLTSVTWGQIDPLNPTNQVEVLENTPSAGIQTITVKDTQPVGSSTKRFMRLKVTRP